MKARLRKTWQSRAPRERIVLAVLAVVIAAVLYLALIISAQRARVPLRLSVVTLQEQATRLEQQAIEYGHLRAAAAPTKSPTDLRTLVQAQITGAGLSHALLSLDAPDPNQTVAVFGAVAFADWLKLIDKLKSQQVRLDSCRIEALSTPGLVSITATLVRPAAP